MTGKNSLTPPETTPAFRSLVSLFLLLIFVTPNLAGCIENEKSINQQEALEFVWQALDPNTMSHNREDWEIHAADRVYGKDVVSEFAAIHRVNCPGPSIPENKPIKITAEYWYIKVVPHPEALRRQQGTSSPELVPVVPEPNIEEAVFLIDLFNGDVIARKILCPQNP